MTADEIHRGIKAYDRERRVLLRLLRYKGSFTEREFDVWFNRRRRLSVRYMDEHSFILGVGVNGFSIRAETLELLQFMILLHEVTVSRENGLIVYKLPEVQS